MREKKKSCLHPYFRFPKGFDIYKEPYEGYTHMPRFLKQEEITQYAVKNSCPDITWNLYGFPMPSVSFKFEGQDIELGEKYTCVYGRNGIVKLQINTFCAADVGTYECYAKNDYGEMSQPVIVVMAQYPEFIKPPSEVSFFLAKSFIYFILFFNFLKLHFIQF